MWGMTPLCTFHGAGTDQRPKAESATSPEILINVGKQLVEIDREYLFDYHFA